ncbi:hypothetical protein EST38_g6445 [Candolleomyces aberdarensis]|uniref:Chromo domain-containing protein n=1 Tax=Candolleomyces aberdarensis TaxID=2316362 RepID=A0A4Q2DHN4_9AGAR|nr:hypothetical protein EST38_g6445 [Candolleomyces aberdarensis]
MARKKKEEKSEEYYVEAILAARVIAMSEQEEEPKPKKRKKNAKSKSSPQSPVIVWEYKVKWYGYDKEEDNTWEPAENLDKSCSRLLKSFWDIIGHDDKDWPVGTELKPPIDWIAKERKRFAREHKKEERKKKNSLSNVTEDDQDSQPQSTPPPKKTETKKKKKVILPLPYTTYVAHGQQSLVIESESDSDAPLARRPVKATNNGKRSKKATPVETPETSPPVTVEDMPSNSRGKKRKRSEEQLTVSRRQSSPLSITDSPNSLFSEVDNEISIDADTVPPPPPPAQLPPLPVRQTVPPLPARPSVPSLPMRTKAQPNPHAKLAAMPHEPESSNTGISTKQRLGQGALAPMLPRKMSGPSTKPKLSPVRTGSSTIMSTGFRKTSQIMSPSIIHQEPTLASLNAAPSSPHMTATLLDIPMVQTPTELELEPPNFSFGGDSFSGADEFLQSIMPPELPLPSSIKPPANLKTPDTLIATIMPWSLSQEQIAKESRMPFTDPPSAKTAFEEYFDHANASEIQRQEFENSLKTRPLFHEAIRILRFSPKIYDYLKQTNRPWAVCPPLDSANGKSMLEVQFMRTILLRIKEEAQAAHRADPSSRLKLPISKEAPSPETAQVIFFHVGALPRLNKFAFLRDRLRSSDYVRFYTFGSHPSVSSKLWGVKEIFPVGGVVTFHPSSLMLQPYEVMQLVRRIEEHPFWTAYILPSVLGMVVHMAQGEYLYSYLLKAIESGQIALIEAPPDGKHCYGQPAFDRRLRWFEDYISGLPPSNDEALSLARAAFHSKTANVPEAQWRFLMEREVAEDLARMQRQPAFISDYRRYVVITGTTVNRQDSVSAPMLFDK